MYRVIDFLDFMELLRSSYALPEQQRGFQAVKGDGF